MIQPESICREWRCCYFYFYSDTIIQPERVARKSQKKLTIIQPESSCSSRLRGSLVMMSVSGGLKDKAVAGRPSVTRFTHSSVTGTSTSGMPGVLQRAQTWREGQRGRGAGGGGREDPVAPRHLAPLHMHTRRNSIAHLSWHASPQARFHTRTHTHTCRYTHYGGTHRHTMQTSEYLPSHSPPPSLTQSPRRTARKIQTTSPMLDEMRYRMKAFVLL